MHEFNTLTQYCNSRTSVLYHTKDALNVQYAWKVVKGGEGMYKMNLYPTVAYF